MIRSRRAFATSMVACLVLAFGVLGVVRAWAVDPDPGAAQLSQQLGRSLQRLADLEGFGPLADTLPASDVLPGEALGLGDVFDDLAARFLNGDGTGKLTNFDAIFDALQVSETIAGLDVTIAEPDVDDDSNGDGIDFVVDEDTGDIDFAVVISVNGSFDAPVHLPTYLIDLVAVGGDGVFAVPVALTSTPLHFHFDLDLGYDAGADAAAETVAESLWIQTNPAAALVGPDVAPPSFSLAVGDGADHDLSDLTDALSLGFAGVDVAGAVALQLLYTLSLIDPDSLNGGSSDFKIAVDEVVHTDLSELVSVATLAPPSGNAVDAHFEIGTDLIGTDTDVDLVIDYEAATLADLATATPTFTPGAGVDLELLENLRSFTPTDALGAVDRLVGMLGGIQSTGFFDLDLPYIDGGTCNNGQDDDGDGIADDGCLGSGVPASGAPETGATGGFSDVLALGAALGSAVTNTTNGLILPPDPATLASGQPSFANAQQLRDKLESGLGTALKSVTGDDITLSLDATDPAAPQLVYELTIQDEATTSVALRFGNLDILSGVVLTAGGTATLLASYEIPLRFALDLSPEPVEDGGEPGSCSDGEDNGEDGLADAFDDDCEGSRTFEQRVSIFVGDGVESRPEVAASAGLLATNIAAKARVGFLEVGISGGSLVFGPADGAEDCTDPGDLADAECRASFDVDLVDTDDGWLTVEEVYAALGNPNPAENPAYQPGWSRTVDHQAGLWASLPVGATLEGVTIPGAALAITGSSTGLLEDSSAPGPFNGSALVDSLSVDASAVHLSKLFSFSACGNGKDDDGDGVIDDGCGDGFPDAVEEPETESLALFDALLDAVRAIAAQFDASSLPAAFSQKLPFINRSYADVFDLASALVELADLAALGAEAFLGPDACTNTLDDDGDGFFNDGCPQVGGFAEGGAQCAGTANDDVTLESNNGTPESVVNDGCPAVAPTLQTFDTMLAELLRRALASGLDTTLAPGAVTVQTVYDEDDEDISFTVAIAPFSVARSFPFTASLPSGLPDLVSLAAGGTLDLTVSGEGVLGFGVDLAAAEPYVLGSTALQLQMDAALADGTTFDAGVGPLTVQVGKTSPGAETDCANNLDDDNDGFINDGCAPVDGPGESLATGQCSYGDTTDDDGDGRVNDGCPARTDSARAFIGAQLHVVETHADSAKVALGDVAFGGGLPGNKVVGGVDQPECLDLHITSAPSATAGTQKHACAILPLYFNDAPVGLAGTTNHHVLLAIKDLGSPGTISTRFDGAGDLDSIIAAQVLDLLLLKSGIGPLIDKLLALINDQLLGINLPVIGTALDQVVALANGLGDLAGAVTAAMEGGDPLAAVDATASASAVADVVQGAVASTLGQSLLDAGILLDPNVPGRVPATDTSALQVLVRCGDDRPCDFGGELDDPNPALDANDADGIRGNNCDEGTVLDDDDDGFANDGCPAQANAESGPDCDGFADDDGDGVENDGCPPVPQVGDVAESNCDGVDDLEEEDGNPDGIDDGCEWPETTAGPNDGEDQIDGACDAGNVDDEDGDGHVNDGCPPRFDRAADVTDIAFVFRIGQAAGASTGPVSDGIEFDPGIPGLGLGLQVENAELQANAGWDLDVGIGVSKDVGFYFVADELALYGVDGDGVGPELNVDATVLVSDPNGPAASLTGTLAFLEAKATDGAATTDPGSPASSPPPGVPAGRSFFNIGASVDLKDPGPTADHRVALSEIAAGPSFSDLIDFSFGGRAELHLGLEVGVSNGEGLPRLRSGVHLIWAWNIVDANKPVALEPGAGSDLSMWMDGLYLDAGSFVSEFLAPVFGDIQKFTKPFEPIIDVLNEPIPVLSDFAGEPVTMRTLGVALAAAYDIDLTLLDMVIDLIDFVNSIKTFNDVGNPSLLIPLTAVTGGALDLEASTLRKGKLPESKALDAYSGNVASKMVGDLRAAVNGKVGGQGSASSNESSGGQLTIGNLDSVGVSFPFLEHPERLAGLLFGKHVTLVQWQPPPLVLKFCYSQKFGPIWSLPPVFIEFGGCIGLTGRFGIGYNTKGFQRALFDPDGDLSGLLQGLFLIDRHPLEGGSDLNELEFRGEIFVNAQVSVLIFSAGAQGSLYLQIGLDLEDPNSDGIVEFGEAANIIRTTGSVLCLFNLNGKLGLEFSVFAEVDLFFWSQRWTKVLADIILYEFKIKCEPLDEPELARSSGSTLFLNMGTDARFRDKDDTGPDNSIGYDEINEKWVVTRTPDGVKVRALGFTQSYPGGWTKVVVTDAGNGDDAVAFVDGQLGGEDGEQCENAVDDDGDGVVNDGCPAMGANPGDPPVPENAPSNGGTPASCLNADDDDNDGFINDGCPIVGDIVLLPFNIRVEVSMGDGNDVVTGGVNGGIINGGNHDDVLIARGAVKYTINGGDGHDSITGSYGDDTIDAGPGNDTVDAGPGADKVIGGLGDDTIDGGRTVKTDPAAGPVVVFADKKDIIWGDTEGDHSGAGHGRDTIDGGEGDDELYGGGAADRITGGPGSDTIKGGDEPNDGCGGDVDDVIVGGPGSDTIEAMGGDDIVVGGNTIAGEPDVGDALLDGGPGCDVIIGDNAVFNSSTNPRAFTLLDPNIGGADLIKGGTGADTIRGQIGDDTIFGDTAETSGAGDGGDQIWGDHGHDTIHAGGGSDTVWGDGGPSHPQFPHGNDVISGGGSGDTLRGEGGTDTIFGDHGKLVGGAPVFTNAASGGNDNILGGPGSDRIYGQEGADVINGDGGDDEIHGDTDTTPSGNDGNDEIRGGTGDDRIFGNDGADRLYGDAGNDLMAGGSQTAGNPDSGTSGGFQDRMFGGSGVDVMAGDNATFDGAGVATLLDESTIGEGDLMYGQLADDVMYGENGNDLMFGGAGDDHMEGGADTDTMFGEADQDDIIGGTTQPAGNDGNGKQPDAGDFLYGQGDADVIIGDNGEITRPGGTWPGGAKKRAVTLYDLDTKNAAFFGADVIEGGMSTDEVYGGGGDDIINGHVAGDPGVGLDGSDHLEGNDGGDTIYGDAGQDDIIGGTSAHVDESPDPDPVMPGDGGGHPDDGMDVLHGGDGTTALDGDHDVLMGDNATVERVLASPTAYQFDDLDADPLGTRTPTTGVLRRRIVQHDVATTTSTPTSPVGAPADGDELHGESGWDELYGQGGDDVLHGGLHDDHLEGGAGEDVLYGEAGQDDLIGGVGRTVNDDPSTAVDGRLDDADELYGGDGADGIAEDDFDVLMGDNATVLRGEPGDAWTYNTFNASVRRALYLYDVGMVDDPAGPGTSDGDLMRGEADDDLMYGQGGPDDMQGGGGDDHMQGNEGADLMLGQAGNDDMVGGTGRINLDPVQGTPGRLDTGETEMRGGDGFDWMAGDNAIIERVLVDGEWVPDPNGGVFRHVLRMPDLFDHASPFGGSRDEADVSGPDTMFGDADHDVMYGQGNGDLADDVIGDVLSGGFGDDHIEGNEGGDQIHGNTGEDDLIGGTGKVLGQDSFTPAEYAALDAVPSDPDLDLPDEVDAALDFGVRNRHDGDDYMTGEHDESDGTTDGSSSDVMLGDNAVVLRPVDDDGIWIVRPENDATLRLVWFPDLEAIDLPAVAAHVHGDDRMWGNDNDDEMWGQGGDDLMYGGAGDDRMQGNHASDEMYGGPGQDDMHGGTGRVNDDPVEGTPGRLDMGDLMFGNDGHDVMTGDNAIIDRPVVDDAWVTLTYKGYPDSTHRSIHVAQKPANKNTAPVAVGPDRGRVERVLTMMDLSPENGGSAETAGSDLMSGGAGDDDMIGQFDDSADAAAPFTRTRDELVVLCDTPDESTLFGPAVDVTVFGDVVCGNSGEDAILGDQGVIVNRPETEGRQKLLVPNTPFSRDWVFIDNTLSRLVTLDQYLEGGHDVILGGDHHDAIHGGAGGDLINGDDGDDFIFGGDGGEIDLGTRQDAIWGGRGHDTTMGGWGDDFIDVQPRANIANFPDDPADWFFFAPPVDELGFFRGFASIDHHYGGWDQDAFQADLGDNGPVHGDRLMDWVGAYNVYYLCPSTYGAWVSLRDLPPDGLKHMEDLATGMGAVDVTTPGSSGFREAAIVYTPDVKHNQNPPHPDTPGHFVCDGINFADPTAT
ncbi:MAG TPA: calcium-binding protein [Acidimicrobiales bacterium]|nr:calcium-binding protein [Acidimicrobiales bacterium]